MEPAGEAPLPISLSLEGLFSRNCSPRNILRTEVRLRFSNSVVYCWIPDLKTLFVSLQRKRTVPP
jgi:hypothetical protein